MLECHQAWAVKVVVIPVLVTFLVKVFKISVKVKVLLFFITALVKVYMEATISVATRFFLTLSMTWFQAEQVRDMERELEYMQEEFDNIQNIKDSLPNFCPKSNELCMEDGC